MTNNKLNFLTLLPLIMVVILDVMGVILILPVLTPLLLQPASGILAPNTSLILRDFIYGLTLAIFPLFMFFSTPILGDLSDKFGRKNILLICLVGTALSYFLSAFGIYFGSLSILLLSRAIAGLGAGTQPLASAAIIDVSTPDTKAQNLGWIVLASTVGIIIGPLLGGLTSEKNLSSWFGYETPFLLAGVLAFLNAILLFFTFKETQPTRSSSTIHLAKGFILFITAFAKPKFRLLSITYFCFLLGWSLYFLTISWFFMEVYGYGSGKIGLFMAYIGVIFAFAVGIVVRVSLKWFRNEINTYLLFILIMGIANIGSALAHSELSQWLWVILNATGDAVCFTVALSLFSNTADKESQGWIMGVAGAIGAITWTLGSVLAGPLGYVNIHLPLWTAGILCFISFLLMLIYKRLY